MNIADPVIKQVFENQGAMYENIMIPITDGKRMYNISCNLKEAYETDSKAIVKAFQKAITLHTVDESWKEHLRHSLDYFRNFFLSYFYFFINYVFSLFLSSLLWFKSIKPFYLLAVISKLLIFISSAEA